MAELPSAPSRGTRVHMAMVGDLAHNAVDNKLARPIFDPRNHRQRFDHKGALFLGRLRAMISQDRHRRVAGVALEQRKFERLLIARVPGRVFLQLTQVAFGHDSKG